HHITPPTIAQTSARMRAALIQVARDRMELFSSETRLRLRQLSLCEARQLPAEDIRRVLDLIDLKERRRREKRRSRQADRAQQINRLRREWHLRPTCQQPDATSPARSREQGTRDRQLR